MAALTELTARLNQRMDLGPADLAAAAAALGSPEVADDAKAAFLAALAEKGETPAEIAGLARAFRALAVNPGDGP